MKKMNSRQDKSLDILLIEYQTLKDEEKHILSLQFTVIGIWLTFLGLTIGTLFKQIEGITEYAYANYEDCNCKPEDIINDMSIMSPNRTIITLLITILIPGTCVLFGLIWLDLTTRFIKEAHYIYIIEHRILANYPNTIGFDHFLFEETKEENWLNKTNYIYYFLMLGILLIACPLLIILFSITFKYIFAPKIIHWFFFGIIILIDYFFGIAYIKRILSYADAKKIN